MEKDVCSKTPRVSIIISAYNRPDVVLFAIRSALRSSFADIEVIVVGDGCNQATVNAIGTISDPRLRFTNLIENSGSQATPHNVGVRQARGEYIMFLNQDDMYFGDHVAHSIQFMEKTGADVAFSPVALVQSLRSTEGPPDPDLDVIGMDGLTTGSFDPEVFVISSSWVMRRQSCEKVGPWLQPIETRLSPSQEWLFRAWRRGQHIVQDPYISVLCIHAGARRHSYSTVSAEHARVWNWVASGPAAGAEILQCVALTLGRFLSERQFFLVSARGKEKESIFDRAIGSLKFLGLHPVVLRRFLAGIPKGGAVASIRLQAEGPDLEIGEVVRVGEPAAERYLGTGWSYAEGLGRWTTGAGEIVSRIVNKSNLPIALRIEAKSLRRPESVSIFVNGIIHSKVVLDGPHSRSITVPIGPVSGPTRIRFEVESPTSPSQVFQSQDERILGIFVSKLELSLLSQTTA